MSGTPQALLTLSGRRRFRGESGYILVMVGLLIIALIAFTAFAVDVGSWYAMGARCSAPRTRRRWRA